LVWLLTTWIADELKLPWLPVWARMSMKPVRLPNSVTDEAVSWMEASV